MFSLGNVNDLEREFFQKEDQIVSLEEYDNGGSNDIVAGHVIPLCREVGTDEPPFTKGQIASLEEYDMIMTTHALNNGYELQRAKSNKNDRANKEYWNTCYKWKCVRSGKPSKKGNGERPKRTSLKVDCGCYANACHPMKADKSGRDRTVVEIVGIDLRHTNGCAGDNELVNKSIKKRKGRIYSDVALTHIKREVKAGRHATHDVRSWLTDQGMTDATLKEATNLRYRLIKDMPVKGYEFEADGAELGAMEDYLFNEDLAREIIAGQKESVDNLRIVHKGLKHQVKGHDYRITTDSENRFSGTAWMTGRMRARLRRCGVFIFLDDSRSGINSSGFCFWNAVTINEDGRVQTVMGAMTMGASNEAVEWLLKMMVEMCPEVDATCLGTMSDLGKFRWRQCHVSNSIIWHPNAHGLCLYHACCCRCARRACKKSTTKCEVLWCLCVAHDDNRLP